MTAPDLLRAVQAVLDRADTKALCQVCWQVVPMQGSHVCDPLERGAALARMTDLVLTDHHKRARGYGVL